MGFCGGKSQLLRVGPQDQSKECSEIRLGDANSEESDKATKLGAFRREIEGLEETIKAELEARFEMEERGLQPGQKVKRKTDKQRKRDRLTQQNTTSAGYIVWLQFPGGGGCDQIVPMPIIPLDSLGVGGDKEFDDQASKGAAEIKECAENILDKVSDSILCIMMRFNRYLFNRSSNVKQ